MSAMTLIVHAPIRQAVLSVKQLFHSPKKQPIPAFGQ
jgi:hypothetical protein